MGDSNDDMEVYSGMAEDFENEKFNLKEKKVSEPKKNKTLKVGQVLLSKNGKTEYLALGQTKGKAEYQYDVDVRITKANGEKIVLKNPTLFFNDPRKFSETPEKIPAFILNDVVFSQQEE